jgi:hypothetical protein
MLLKLTKVEGEILVRLARKTVEDYLQNNKVKSIPKDTPAQLMQCRGVFVTIKKIDNGKEPRLRGCIGYPYPTTKLAQAVIECAISSATQDPRFHPVSTDELDQITFEVSVLTSPELIITKNPKDLKKRIQIGRDGLIVERGANKGLLLPQVALEYSWDAEEFLSQCCMKAALPPDTWLVKGTRIYKFQCFIAKEIAPKGVVTIG